MTGSDRASRPRTAELRPGQDVKLDSPVAGAARPKAQIDSLHGLRFLAAFGILAEHAVDWIGAFQGSTLFIQIASTAGVFAMPLFFVLSGVVIQYNYSKSLATGRYGVALLQFATARFARLFPLYAAFQLVGMLLDAMPLWLEHYKPQFFVFLGHAATLTQSWFPIVLFGKYVYFNGFGLSWSISTELFFYLSFPLIAAALQYVKTPRLALILLATFALVCTFAAVEAALWRGYIAYWADRVLPQTAPSADDFIYFLLYISPWSRIFEFVLGCLAARLYTLLEPQPPSPREQAIGRFTLWAAFAVLAFLAWANASAGSGGAFMTTLFFVVQHAFGSAIPIVMIIFCVARYRTWLSAALAAPVMVAFGEMSYSLYAVHSFVLRPLAAIDSPPLTTLTGGFAVAKIAAGVALTFLMSYGTYRLIERPSRSWIRARASVVLARVYGADPGRGILRSPASRLAASAAMFALLLAACMIYQFAVVPRFVLALTP
jgi:peptidoglycan/LPS O-acetylase OafA/YrhL